MTESYPFSIRSWFDVYQALRARAEAARGTETQFVDGAASATWPRTNARDAFAIAVAFDEAVADHGSGQLVSRWISESDQLAGEPEHSRSIYAGNRSLWETLATAATELDNRQVALPDRALVDAALRELAADDRAADDRDTSDDTAEYPPHNPGASMVATVFTEPTWKAMAVRQLEFFRALRGEVRGGGRLLPTVPCTRNSDVLALAAYWTQQLSRIGDDASDTFHRLLYSAWHEVVARASRAERAPAHETYAYNFEFWTALLLLATQSDACSASPTPWTFQVPAMCDEPRNAGPIETDTEIDFPAAKTWDEAAQMQRDAFTRLRGADQVAGRLIGRVPRTTVADVRQLAAYWSIGLATVGVHSFADKSYRHVVQRWQAATAQVRAVPLTVDPTSVYVHNTDFWEALMTIAIQVAVTAESPTRWKLIKAATRYAIAELPNTLRSAGKSLVTDVLAKPLLYAGIGLGGLALAVWALRRPAQEHRS